MFPPQVPRNKAKTSELKTYRWWAARQKALIVWREEPAGQWTCRPRLCLHTLNRPNATCGSDGSQRSREFFKNRLGKSLARKKKKNSLVDKSQQFHFPHKGITFLIRGIKVELWLWKQEVESCLNLYPLPSLLSSWTRRRSLDRRQCIQYPGLPLVFTPAGVTAVRQPNHVFKATKTL